MTGKRMTFLLFVGILLGMLFSFASAFAEDRNEQVQADLAVLESSAPEKKMRDAVRSDIPDVCHLLERVDAGRRILTNVAAGYQESVSALQVDKNKVRTQYRTVATQAVKKLFSALTTETRGRCFEGEGTFFLSDPVDVFDRLGWVYDDAELTPTETGFGPRDVRMALLTRGRAAVSKYRNDLSSQNYDTRTNAYFKISAFIRAGFTADDLGLSPAEVAQVMN